MSYAANFKKLSDFITHRGLLNISIMTDGDGTVFDFQDRPEDVSAPASLIEDIQYLSQHARSFNMITGRDIAFIDRCLAPLQVNISAEHHTMRRMSNGPIETLATAINWMPLEDDFNKVSEIAKGVWVESNKMTSRTIHYRLVDAAMQPLVEKEILVAAKKIADMYNKTALAKDYLGVKQGALAIEIGSHAQDKGKALAEFMDRPENAGAVPLFFGDSKADEPAGLEAIRLGGSYGAVGPDKEQQKLANFHFENPENFRHALSEICKINRNIIKANEHFRSYDVS